MVARHPLQPGRLPRRRQVAAIALLEDRLIFGKFELCAEGYLNRKDVASLISEVLGGKIEVGNIDLDKPTEDSKNSGGDKQMSEMKPMIDWYDQHGLVGNPLILRAILGHEPRTLRGYFEELAAKPQASR